MPKTDSGVAAGHTGQMSPECGFMIKALHPGSLLSLFSCPPAKGGSFLLKRARTEQTRARALCVSKSNSEDHSSASRASYSSSTASGLGLRSPASDPGPHGKGLPSASEPSGSEHQLRGHTAWAQVTARPGGSCDILETNQPEEHS